jgi:hypothetical protein
MKNVSAVMWLLKRGEQSSGHQVDLQQSEKKHVLETQGDGRFSSSSFLIPFLLLHPTLTGKLFLLCLFFFHPT